MATTLSEVIEFINTNMTSTDRSAIIQAMNSAQRRLEQRAAADLYPGVKVEFKDRSGATIRGTVKKVNRRTIFVQPENGFTQWRVSPQLLKVVPR